MAALAYSFINIYAVKNDTCSYFTITWQPFLQFTYKITATIADVQAAQSHTVLVKHIYFTTQHLPSVFSEVLMACWYYSAFYSCSHIQKNGGGGFLSGWKYDS